MSSLGASSSRRWRIAPGVFDEDKLAWANRHYLKLLAPDRLAALAVPYLKTAGQILGTLVAFRCAAGSKSRCLAWRRSIDRLTQLPDRLATVFTFSAAATMTHAASELREPGASAVVRGLADELGTGPRLLDKETFRAAAGRVRDKTGQKGKALFHPIRVALTGAGEGPELDLIVPAIDRAVELGGESGLAKVIGCRERAAAIAALI